MAKVNKDKEKEKKIFGASHSKMATYRRCRQQFHWKYINKYFPPSSMGQARGTAGHAALATWHVSYTEDLATKAAWENWSNAGFGDNQDWQQLYQALLRYYVWSKQHDTFVLKVAEQKFDIEYEVEGIPAMFNGFIDGIVEDSGKLWLLENKFYKRMDNSSLDMDQQVSLYLLAAHLLKYDVQGVIYNMVRVGDTKIAVTEPVVRRKIYRSSAGLSKIQDEMLTQVREMMIYELKGGAPYRNPTKDCSWDCSFYAACISMTDDGIEPTDFLKTLSEVRSNDNG